MLGFMRVVVHASGPAALAKASLPGAERAGFKSGEVLWARRDYRVAVLMAAPVALLYWRSRGGF